MAGRYCGLIHSSSAAIVRISETCSTGRSVSARAWTARIAPSAHCRAHVVLGLDLLAVAGREAHAEVRQAVRPRPGDAELRRAVDRIEAEDRVTVERRGDRAEELGALLLGRVGDTALDPHLVDGLAPAGEDADAVAAGRDGVEVLVQGVPAQPLEHALAHLVRGLHVEGDARDHAQRAEADDDAVEVRRRRASRSGRRRRRSRARPRGPPWRGCRWRRPSRGWRSRSPRRSRCAAATRGCAAPTPCAARGSASSPYFSPAPQVTVPAAGSTTTSAGRPSTATSCAESATSLNECREPSACTRGARATIARRCSSVAGRCSVGGAVDVVAGPVGRAPRQARPRARSMRRPRTAIAVGAQAVVLVLVGQPRPQAADVPPRSPRRSARSTYMSSA